MGGVDLPVKRFTALDFYRFVAAFGVVLLHFTEFAQYDQTTGFGGAVFDFAKFVDFFFILSGFVIGLTSFNSIQTPHQIFVFLKRRFARIYPMHLLTLTLFVLPVVAGKSASFEKLDASALIPELFLVRYWKFHAAIIFNFPSWSISAEWAMYLLFPVFVMSYRRLGWVSLMVIAAAAILLIEYFLLSGEFQPPMWFIINTPVRALPTFLIGILLSKMYDRFPLRNGVYLGAIVFGLSIISMVLRANIYLELILFALSILFTASGYAAGDRTIFDHRISQELGSSSYSLYMLHIIFLIIFVQKLWPHLSTGAVPIWYGVALSVLTTIASVVSYHAYERPMRTWISGWKVKSEAIALRR